jgi:protein-tyrosine phosphatase
MTGFENTCTLSDYADCIIIENADDPDDVRRPPGQRVVIYLGDFRSATSWRLLQDAKVTGICNCTMTVPNHFPQHFDYFNVPIADTTTDDDTTTRRRTTATTGVTTTLQSLWDAATAFLHDHDSTLVHCHQGKSRSVAVVVAYLIRYHQYTRDDALSYVRRHRHNRGLAATAPNRSLLRQLTLFQYRHHHDHESNCAGASSSSLSADDDLSRYYTVAWAEELLTDYYHYYYYYYDSRQRHHHYDSSTKMDNDNRNIVSTIVMSDVCPQHARYILPVAWTVVVMAASAASAKDVASPSRYRRATAAMEWLRTVLIQLQGVAGPLSSNNKMLRTSSLCWRGCDEWWPVPTCTTNTNHTSSYNDQVVAVKIPPPQPPPLPTPAVIRSSKSF